MLNADIIVMATPLYFFSASAQIKQVFDRMFSLYKWDNAAGTMKTALKGKTFAVIASAFEADGFDALEKPFKMTADYSGMKYTSFSRQMPACRAISKSSRASEKKHFYSERIYPDGYTYFERPPSRRNPCNDTGAFS